MIILRIVIVLMLGIFPGIVRAGVAVLTQHNDISRTGMNLSETVLNVQNVNTNSFSLLYSRPVDDQIYAQPLIATNVAVGGGTHNIVIVCTVNTSIYAFDADDSTVVTPYWTNNFVNPPTIVPARNTDLSAAGACGGNYQFFTGAYGIVGTPVIDPATGTMYVVVNRKEMLGSFVSYSQKLHALDITTGKDRIGSPVTISATYPGTNMVDSTNGVLTFSSFRLNQRPGLLLLNGVVYVGWTSHCDWDPYHGWLMGFDATTLQHKSTFNTSPNGSRAGIWMSGQAPAADTNGNIYVSTGNGSFNGTANFGDCFLRLTPSGTNLAVTSWFAPYNWASLDAQDWDLGSSGILLIPRTALAFAGGKEGKAYLVNRDNLGGLNATSADTNIVQSFQVTPDPGADNIHGGPVWWDGADGSYAYVWGESDYMHQFKFDRDNGVFFQPEYARSATTAPPGGMPGGILAVSANGSNAGSGIVWAVHQYTGDAVKATRPGILHAYDAANIGNELWNSQIVSNRDGGWNFAKFVPPTVANGKVYMATFSNKLNVFGLFRPPLSVVPSGSNMILSWPVNGFSGYQVQTCAELVAGIWSTDNHTIVQANGKFQVTIPMSAAPTYFRLKK